MLGISDEEIEQKIYERQKIFHWVIDGMGQHGLKISDVKNLTPEWICENYNVEMDFFTKK